MMYNDVNVYDDKEKIVKYIELTQEEYDKIFIDTDNIVNVKVAFINCALKERFIELFGEERYNKAGLFTYQPIKRF